MIITRTPFRISFAGGGTDLPAYYARESGAVLASAIDRYMFLAVKEHFGNTFRISYSRTELVDSIDRIEHPIVRECLQVTGVRRALEIVSMADLPAQSGMGSSSSFTVGLLHALYAMQGKVMSAEQLAEQACHIEIDRLHEPIGKQDQYIAAHGGLQFIRFNSDGTVFVDPVICKTEAREELNRRLLLFFTGMTRKASEVLSRQSARTDDHRPALRKLCEIACQLREVLSVGRDLNAFGRLLHEAWEIKKTLDPGISNSRIDEFYERGLRAGGLGGKLLGAGGGGFLLFYCEPHRQGSLRKELAELTEVPFRLDLEGTKIIYVGGDHW